MNQSLMKLLQIMKMIYQVGQTQQRIISSFAGSGVELLQHVGEGGLSPGEDHQPSDPQLQEVHHREWKSHNLESGWNLKNLGEKYFLQEREVIESKLSQCIQLNTDYREAYQKIKNKKVPLCRCTWRFDILSRL